MPKRYLIKQNKPWFTYNHDNNVDFVADVYHVYWSLENKKKIRLLGKIKRKSAKFTKLKKAEFDICKAENSDP